jgi:hypothetical protein
VKKHHHWKKAFLIQLQIFKTLFSFIDSLISHAKTKFYQQQTKSSKQKINSDFEVNKSLIYFFHENKINKTQIEKPFFSLFAKESSNNIPQPHVDSFNFQQNSKSLQLPTNSEYPKSTQTQRPTTKPTTLSHKSQYSPSPKSQSDNFNFEEINLSNSFSPSTSPPQNKQQYEYQSTDNNDPQNQTLIKSPFQKNDNQSQSKSTIEEEIFSEMDKLNISYSSKLKNYILLKIIKLLNNIISSNLSTQFNTQNKI